MATKLMVHFEIDALIPQIEASWNKWTKTKEAREHFGGRTPPTTFAKGETPWTTKQSVLERNYFWANKLIALYIELNVDVADRWPVWKFFEIRPSGVVSCVKDQISRLKRAEKAIKTAKKLAVKASKQAAKVAAKRAKVEKAKAKAIAKVEKTKAKAIAKEAAKNIAKVEKAKAKAIAKEAVQRKKWLAKIDAQNYGIQFDRENYSIKTLKKICRDIPSLKIADKKLDKQLDKQRAKVEKAKAKAIAKEAAKNIAKVEKAKAKADKIIATLENKSLGFIKWCVANDVSIEDAIKMVQASM
jgi:hypothetical protein